MRRTLLGVVALALASLGVGAAQAVVVDRVAGVVNDDVITLSEVYQLGGDFIEQHAATGPDARRDAELEVLDSLIQRRLISQEIERLGLDVEDVELERTIDDIGRRNGLDRDQLRAEIERTGMSWTQYRSELKENLRQAKFSQAVIQPRISVNEDELRDAYRRMVASVDRPKVVELGAMFLTFPSGADDAAKAAVLDEAKAARSRIAAGESFAAIAAEVDDGPYGAQGGAMGTYRQGELVGELDRPAFALEPGTTSEPIVTGQGVFLIEVRSRVEEPARAFEEARDALFQQVYADRIEDETDQWYRQARRQAAVQVKLESSTLPTATLPTP